MPILLETNLALPLFARGKVRDTYSLGNELLMVTTDRISAFDVVLSCGIPDKGLVLNQLSIFWFKKTAHLIPNHLIKGVNDIDQLSSCLPAHQDASLPYLVGRSMIVRKAERIPVECVVRGYLSGSAWAEYIKGERIADISLPKGLRESEKLPEPIFTPTTKAETGHDLPLDRHGLKNLVGADLAYTLEEKSLAIYNYALNYAQSKGIIIADTKFEFGIIDGKLSLIDELLTPDSSRFWDMTKYLPGTSQPSFDKQLVRDWLVASGWDKEPPAPSLPPEVIENTAERYREVYRRLAGKTLTR